LNYRKDQECRKKNRLRRDKTGFWTPQDEWFKSVAWQKIIRELINSESFKNRNLIDPQKAFMQYEKHLAGSINIAKEIWNGYISNFVSGNLLIKMRFLLNLEINFRF